MIISTHIFSRPELYQKLLETAKRQLEWCRNADWEQEETEKQLAELVEARQALIEQISALDQGPLSPEEKQIVEEIIVIDSQSTKLMADFKNQFIRKLHKVKQVARTTKAYNPEAVQTEGYFIDRRE
ncbi:MAG: flagellar protein FliT [Firmicutes bacterium]|jgi:ABC-type nitrate/sulfonate/bicarbonate transport system substrate-binding protein|nr:flagellar protein FliT [Bacillota bacterium]NLL88407.1 flagellar protein FliT [Bacillota bacterium]HKM17572.1 flagellar protein FliT [Limnochordia bacterium]